MWRVVARGYLYSFGEGFCMGREAIQRIEEHTFPPHTFAWAQTTYNEKLGGIPFVILWSVVQHKSSVSRKEGTTQRWQKPTVRPRGSGHRERVNVTYWWWDGPLASWLPCYFLFRRSYLTLPPTTTTTTVFISYSCATNYHRFSNLRQHIFIISQFPWVRNLDIGLNWVLLLGSHKTDVRVLAGLHSHLELDWGRVHFQAHSGCWQNSSSCGHMTKCHHLLLVVG